MKKNWSKEIFKLSSEGNLKLSKNGFILSSNSNTYFLKLLRRYRGICLEIPNAKILNENALQKILTRYNIKKVHSFSSLALNINSIDNFKKLQNLITDLDTIIKAPIAEYEILNDSPSIDNYIKGGNINFAIIITLSLIAYYYLPHINEDQSRYLIFFLFSILLITEGLCARKYKELLLGPGRLDFKYRVIFIIVAGCVLPLL